MHSLVESLRLPSVLKFNSHVRQFQNGWEISVCATIFDEQDFLLVTCTSNICVETTHSIRKQLTSDPGFFALLIVNFVLLLTHFHKNPWLASGTNENRFKPLTAVCIWATKGPWYAPLPSYNQENVGARQSCQVTCSSCDHILRH